MLSAATRDLIPAQDSAITFVMGHLSPQERKAFIDSLPPIEAQLLEYSWDLWARQEQRPPKEWVDKTKHTWVILGGRGQGKTRLGSEMINERVVEIGKHYRNGLVALIAKDPSDARKVMLEGESGILTVSPPWFRPHWEPSKTQVTWPNGVIGNIFSTETPGDLRGPQHHFGWWDEPAKAKNPQETWDMYQLGLRLGEDPQTILTGTPRPIKTLKAILADPDTCVTRGTTMANAANLAPSFLRYVLRKYEGTRLGRQELNAELLDDTPGALWTLAMIDAGRVERAPSLKKVVIAIDPQGAHPEDHEEDNDTAETGLTALGLGYDDELYVLDDRSERLSPDDWGKRAVEMAFDHGAEEIVGEINNGGAMVEFVVRTAAMNVRTARRRSESHTFIKVTASRGKRTRAEPISALYEQGRVHHVGAFPALEDQMSTWVPGMTSPDRMDSLVWGATRLMFPDGDQPIDHVRAGMDSEVSW